MKGIFTHSNVVLYGVIFSMDHKRKEYSEEYLVIVSMAVKLLDTRTTKKNNIIQMFHIIAVGKKPCVSIFRYSYINTIFLYKH